MDTQIIDACKKLAEAGKWTELKQELAGYFKDLPDAQSVSVEEMIDAVVAQAQLTNAISVPLIERAEYLYDRLIELDKADAAIDEAVAKHELRKQLSQD